MKTFIITISLMLFYYFDANAQAVLAGKVKDSTYKYVLTGATISVLKNKDDALIQFCLPNNLGEFVLNKLPFNDTLKLEVTHVGYNTFSKKIVINKKNSPLDLGWIYMHKISTTEEEVVVVSTAPVRLNGDTMEFNPRAFKMDSAATVEDFMRKLPGFTIWSDGEITYNGKKISTLYVDGKPFMGGTDFTIATQNLPKNAIEKLQVYQQVKKENLLDSTLIANIKLKEDKKIGHFGKVGAGIGTDNRYTADAMLSAYNKKLQISVAGGTNNINKIANNADMLIKNSSFKGEGINVDYQPNFMMSGLNKPVDIGIKLQYDFKPNVPNQPFNMNRKILNADYFFEHNNLLGINSTTTITSLGNNDELINKSQNTTTTNSNPHKLRIKFAPTTSKIDFDINSDFSVIKTNSNYSNSIQQEKANTTNLSNSISSIVDNKLQQSVSLNLRMNKHQNYNNSIQDRKRFQNNFSFGYNIGIDDVNSNKQNISSFNSLVNPNANTLIDRIYAKDNYTKISQVFSFNYPEINKLIFGKFDFYNISMNFSTNLTIENNKYISDIKDLDTISKNYLQNVFLTNTRNENTTNLTSGIDFNKYFHKSLSNRYSKSFVISFGPKFQMYNKQNIATQSFQNFKYKYNYFVPYAYLSYNNSQFGTWDLYWSLNFSANINYPTMDQLAPLADNANLWYMPKGNLSIKPERNNSLSTSFSLTGRKPKNPYRINITSNFSTTENKFSDSVYYDNSGRNIRYQINVNGYKSLSINTNFNKSYSKDKRNTYSFDLLYNFRAEHIPQYIDGNLLDSKSYNHNAGINFGYTYKDVIVLMAKQSLGFNSTIQNNNESLRFKNKNLNTTFSGTFQMPKKLIWNTNVTFSSNTANNQNPINFTIWNAGITYRCLKGDKGELKFVALDILHQNKGIINYTMRNAQVLGYRNILQQYFMVSFAYFPRKFGK